MISLRRLAWRRKRQAPSDVVHSTLCCPLRGSAVDIEQCFACGKLLRVAAPGRPSVACGAFGRAVRPSDLVAY